MIKVIKVILSTERTVGIGTQNDPVRITTQMFDMKGNLLLHIDPRQAPSVMEESISRLVQ